RCPPISPPARAPVMPAAPNSRPVRQRTRPARAWPTALTAEVAPTTTSEAVIASAVGMPATYVSSGTMRIDPPPPSRPRVSPTTAARATTAAISIGSPRPGQPVQCGAGGPGAALVPRHLRQGHAHRAGVGDCGEHQAAADGAGQPLGLRGDGAGEDAGSHE